MKKIEYISAAFAVIAAIFAFLSYGPSILLFAMALCATLVSAGAAMFSEDDDGYAWPAIVGIMATASILAAALMKAPQPPQDGPPAPVEEATLRLITDWPEGLVGVTQRNAAVILTSWAIPEEEIYQALDDALIRTVRWGLYDLPSDPAPSEVEVMEVVIRETADFANRLRLTSAHADGIRPYHILSSWMDRLAAGELQARATAMGEEVAKAKGW